MNTKLGYLLPEFPGQTHTFFWREVKALESMGIDIDIVSTKRPALKIMSHTWCGEAQQRTTYLFPPSKNLINSILELLRCGQSGWWRCLQAIIKAKDTSLAGKLRLTFLIFIGTELSYLARSRGWKHLHVHSCADAANVAMFASLLSGVPYSITLHGPLSDYGSNQPQKWHYAKFATVITNKLYQEIHRDLAGYLPPKIAIVPMGVDTSAYQRRQPYSPWTDNTICKIFSCGRLNPVKGHEDLIRAINLLKKQGIDARLTIAGDEERGQNEYRQKLQQLIQELGLNDCISLLGAVSETVLRQNLELAHVFSLASWEEPLGVAIMEAMSMEVPVVVTKAGGVTELVEHEVSGLLVEPHSPQQLADSITKIIIDRELSINLGKTARNKAIASFNSRRGAEVLVKEFTIVERSTMNYAQ
jgi:colanic acid/amylovoran biosynthesis glycosyltransferase